MITIKSNMHPSTVQITVKLFAAYQEAFGLPEINLEVPAGTTAEQVRDRLIEQRSELARWRDLTRFGVNLQFVVPNTVLQDGDELVLIPPVSGG